ncbi:putative tbc domain-containing protein [Golovinomyces cichoracearum]|uniref:Putative tbc domain-containing protein n=1 Tax=Golovinomyces cichoracearum TaxID=62708 RepID=A0A420J0W6_9PEZI|nr:putative tbc domain-containing protein [Golovinomyces cichoracearum]
MKSRSSISLRRNQFVLTPYSQMRVDNGILTVRYEEALLSKPPIAVTVPPPTHPPTDVHPAFRKSFENIEENDRKRDSGLANTTSSRCEERRTETASPSCSLRLNPLKVERDRGNRIDSNSSYMKGVHLPAMKIGSLNSSSLDSPENFEENWETSFRSKCDKDTTKSNKCGFSGIQTRISTEQWLGDTSLDLLSLPKSESVMIDRQKAVEAHSCNNNASRQPIVSISTDISDLNDEIERESENIRSMYEKRVSPNDEKNDGSFNQSLDDNNSTNNRSNKHSSYVLVSTISQTSESKFSGRCAHEFAGGIEDWEDIDGRDIDRYGFITKFNSDTSSQPPELVPPHRISTILQLAANSPRRRRGVHRISSTVMSMYKYPHRSVSTKTTSSDNQSPFVKSTRKDNQVWFPTSRFRRLVDEAGDMLTLPCEVSSMCEAGEENLMENIKRKEWRRVEKWKKMAKIITPAPGGEGMKFEFDAKSAKLAQRTWKGIPDRWRAAAWYSFLRTSAKNQNISTSESEIISCFYQLLQENSIDDVQIDLDVPRTINSHIMFRKRYRGGQRLLFRVLHCFSLYSPKTGYVQGMASLAATLLCYYDEEKAFIMLVRLWTLRSMDKLYDPGFQGLMTAFEEFKKNWVNNDAVSKKLETLCIEPTAYGTRWYLTLFNYSIPFSAQLRVWDVFMLLGDRDTSSSPENFFSGGLSILHATSAALIDATREILLESDFENAMKTLTSWIPIKDDELFMRVVRAEWKLHHKKRLTS